MLRESSAHRGSVCVYRHWSVLWLSALFHLICLYTYVWPETWELHMYVGFKERPWMSILRQLPTLPLWQSLSLAYCTPSKLCFPGTGTQITSAHHHQAFHVDSCDQTPTFMNSEIKLRSLMLAWQAPYQPTKPSLQAQTQLRIRAISVLSLVPLGSIMGEIM